MSDELRSELLALAEHLKSHVRTDPSEDNMRTVAMWVADELERLAGEGGD